MVNVRVRLNPLQIATVQVQSNPAHVGKLVWYENQSQGNPSTAYRWKLDDATQANDAEPTHRYTEPGEYRIVIRVKNDAGYGRAIRDGRGTAQSLPPCVQNLSPQTRCTLPSMQVWSWVLHVVRFVKIPMCFRRVPPEERPKQETWTRTSYVEITG